MEFEKLLTAVDCQEEGSVHAVVDEGRLTVQHGCGVNSAIDGVYIQPACWVLVDRIPEKKSPATSHYIHSVFLKHSLSAEHKLPCKVSGDS